MIRRRIRASGLVLAVFLLLVVVVHGTATTNINDGSCGLNNDDGDDSPQDASCQAAAAAAPEEDKGDVEVGSNDSHSASSKKGGDSKDDTPTTKNTAAAAAAAATTPITHATIITENKEEVTIELSDDLLQRIHAALVENGVVGSEDQSLIQKLAIEEVHKWHQEEEHAQQARELLLEQRQQQQQQHNEEKPEFPYDLTVPPPPSWNTKNGKPEYSLDFCKDWKPLGGGRYAEYAQGYSPYSFSSETQQNRSDEIARLRRPYIQQAMQHAWDGYRRYAFGYDEVRPQSKKGTNHWGGISVTLVDSLDTLWIMNMKEEFQQARDYVRDELSHDQDRKVSVFETTIRSLGGLLSAYDWSRDTVFLDEALDLARRLMKAFLHPIAGETILPFGEVNLQDGSCNMIPWAGGNAILSEFGTLQIEFRYLDEVVQTSETRGFRDKVEQIFELLHDMSPDNGLFPYYMKTNHPNSKTSNKRTTTQAKPHFSNDHLTFGAMADSFYEYMLKLWIQGGKTEPMYRTMYDKAMQGMHDELLHISTPSGLTYLADKVGVKTGSKKRIKHKMDHLVCFVGGMLALGAHTDPLGLESERAQRDLQTAKALTYTCYQMYARMNTGISPEYVEFVAGQDFRVGPVAPHYLLRPEAVESFYILNVLTGDPIYREWGWEVFQSIEKYCKTHVAYGSIGNVQNEDSKPRDEMESFFLAETLKYLYLLHDPESEIDILNKHVFNTEAHPMRVFNVIQEETTREERAERP